MKKLLLTGLLLSFLVGCATQSPKPNGVTVIKYDYHPGEIKKLCDDQMKATTDRIQNILSVSPPNKNFSNTIEALENTLADLSENTTPATFMNYVSLDKTLRSEAEQCEASLSQYLVGLMSRRDIYDAFKLAERGSKNLDQAGKRLIEETSKAFRKSGLFLPDDKLLQVKELKQKLATLETQFAANLNESTDFVTMTREELEGTPETFVSRLEKIPDGKYKVTTKSTDYITFLENAKNSSARKRLAEAYENRAAEKNTKILEEAIRLRRDIAHLMKFKNWADYKTEDHMAKNSATVMKFLNSLRDKLKIKNKEDMDHLLSIKKEMEPGATQLNAWDGTYYSNQLKKRDYAVDDEVVREYFPAQHTVAQMFDIYSQILGVKFVPVLDANVWAPEVKLYEIHDAKDNSLIGHFFTDFVPRDGKYGHAAAFTLRSGRLVSGQYRTPISAIVANFTPPSADRPSLMTHSEVETLFHEFGHIMHQTLTKAKYASISGTSVAQDFVEAPSQMLENWVWDPTILKMISSHYKDHKPLPDDLIQKLIKTHDFNRGYFYTRQLLFGLFDMKLHTSEKDLDPTQTYKDLYKELTSIDPLEKTHFPAGFGHLMGGYDAGYYGYLWSEVFAEDMFTKFEKEGLVSSVVGERYRQNILEQGDTYPADELLVRFLKRKPNNKAFFKRLGIK